MGERKRREVEREGWKKVDGGWEVEREKRGRWRETGGRKGGREEVAKVICVSSRFELY